MVGSICETMSGASEAAGGVMGELCATVGTGAKLMLGPAILGPFVTTCKTIGTMLDVGSVKAGRRASLLSAVVASEDGGVKPSVVLGAIITVGFFVLLPGCASVGVRSGVIVAMLLSWNGLNKGTWSNLEWLRTWKSQLLN